MTSISTSTSALFERAKTDMTALRARADKLQQQISNGSKLSKSSDNPVAASRMRTLMRADRLSEIDVASTNRAGTDLSLTDAALSSFANYITRAKELATQAANGTLTDAQRASIGAEITQIHGNVRSLANARDSTGRALFGGETGGNAYSLDSSGRAIYLGTGAAAQVSIGEGQTIARGLTGPEFLNFDVNATPTDLMAVLKTLGDALQTGTPDPATAARDALGALDTGLDTVTTQQTIIGARLNWIDQTNDRAVSLSEQRATEEADLDGTDIASTVVDLQHAMLVLEASQASFAKLSGLSLFNQLR